MNLTKLKLNDEVKNEISSAFDSGSFPHAVLITGGTPKDRKALALHLAAALECETPGKEPCMKCSQCIKAKDGAHPDIIITEGNEKKHSISMDNVKSIRSDAYILPNEGRYEVFVILESSAMAEDAQNALLKVLEEPPKHVRFILTSQSKDDLLETILSRVTNYQIGEADSFSPQLKESKKGIEASLKAAQAIADKNEYRLLLSTASLVKDKNALRTFYFHLSLILRDALTYSEDIQKASGNEKEASLIAHRFTKPQIMKMTDTLTELSSDIDKNLNETLMLTRTSILISQSF